MDNWILNTPFQLWPENKKELNSIEFSQFKKSHKILFRFFEPQNTVAVLANSNDAATELNLTEIEARKIPVLRRKGGGGTVILSPGCLVLSFAFYAKELFNNAVYFEIINNLWIEALKSAGLKNVAQRGHSDIAVTLQNGVTLKIAGTSLFRRKHLVVYQGSLLVDPQFSLITDLLPHPSREPDYRKARKHLDFITSTAQQGLPLSASELASHCHQYFSYHAHEALRAHFVEADKLPSGFILD